MTALDPPSPDLEPTARTTVKRAPDRARYERAFVHAVLDEGLVAHVGIADDDGQPFVLPMVYARDGERLLLHGSVASRMGRRLEAGVKVCVTVTLLDGIVLARSAFHHSLNYRSVVVLGVARKVIDEADRARAFECLVEQVAPGRAAEVREPNAPESRQTILLELPIAEASAKTRTGPPVEDPIDLQDPTWGGVIPVSLRFGAPEPDEHTPTGAPVPASAVAYGRPARRRP
ncbi:MAG: pyridoxamine 5'-phosphate oxidase family protein [Actinomycetota bacterium]|nr:pyridoxamine 5'-phosphate oxidase family protein [Actinomycetota bacterium]